MTDRAVSPVVSYVLILGIVALLLSGLTAGFAPLVANQQADAVHSTLDVLGNDIAGDVDSADRLAVAAGSDGSVTVRTRLPERVGGSPYEIEIAEVDPTDGEQLYELTLESVDHETSAIVRIRTQTEIDVDAIGTIDGGTFEITFDGNRLVIENA